MTVSASDTKAVGDMDMEDLVRRCEVCGMETQDFVYSLPYSTTRKPRRARKSKFLGVTKRSIWPNISKVSQGNHSKFSHNGIMAHAWDFAVPTGTPVIANRDGVVVDTAAHFKKGGLEESFRSKANFVVVRFGDGSYGRYYHLKHSGVKVKKGQHVKKGEVLAMSGSTGYSAGPHIHFDVQKQYVKEIGSIFIDSKRGQKEIECSVANISCKLPPKGTVIEFEMYLDETKYCNSGKASVFEEGTNTALVCYRGINTFEEKAHIAMERGAKALVVINTDYSMKEVLSQIGVIDKSSTEMNKQGKASDLEEKLVEILHDRKENLKETLVSIPVFLVSAVSGEVVVDSIKSGHKAMSITTHEHNSYPDDFPYRLPHTIPVRIAIESESSSLSIDSRTAKT